MITFPEKSGDATAMLELTNINSRPSGLNGTNVEKFNSHIRRKRTFNIKTISDILHNGAIERWIVISSGRRSVLVRYLFLKFLYDELTKEEYKIFLSFNEVTSIVPIYFALRARYKGYKKKYIRKVLEIIQFPGFARVTREEYQSLRQIQFSFEKRIFPPIEKPKPYSGYSKGYKDGKRNSKLQIEELDSSPLEPSPIFEDEVNILLEFLAKASSHPRKLTELINILGDSYEFQNK